VLIATSKCTNTQSGQENRLIFSAIFCDRFIDRHFDESEAVSVRFSKIRDVDGLETSPSQQRGNDSLCYFYRVDEAESFGFLLIAKWTMGQSRQLSR
jgi:hypothetical protein